MPSSSHTVERGRPLLGTVVGIRASGPRRQVDAATSEAFAAVADIERRMSFHHPASELSRLNRVAHHDAQRVHPDTFRVLRAALAFARASDGVFDPTVGARLVALGQLPAPAPGEPPVDASWRDIELRPDGTVYYRRRAWVDLGGIAKGHAVDAAVRVLRAAGVGRGIVNAGGDLRAFGDVAEVIRVRDPAAPIASVPLLELRDGAVATSAGYFSARQVDGATSTALLDPRDGRALGLQHSVSVCAARAIWADALTKVVLADEARAVPLLRRLHAQAVILRDGEKPRMLAT